MIPVGFKNKKRRLPKDTPFLCFEQTLNFIPGRGGVGLGSMMELQICEMSARAFPEEATTSSHRLHACEVIGRYVEGSELDKATEKQAYNKCFTGAVSEATGIVRAI